jgi:N-acylglucosamine-6-phosphate 2-epimerase
MRPALFARSELPHRAGHATLTFFSKPKQIREEIFPWRTALGVATAGRSALARLEGRLVVSVQADPGSPLQHLSHIAALVRCALVGGAAGLRLEGVDTVAAIRRLTEVPLIGLVKQPQHGSPVYITPTAALARSLAAAGADIVAVDATLRPRPEPFAAIARAAHEAGAEVLADIATPAEAAAALAQGADAVATTLAGYVDASPVLDGPDFALMGALAAAGTPFVAEGHVRTPAQARRCAEAGARFVVVGSAITRPDVITQWFAAALGAVPGTAAAAASSLSRGS